MTHVNTTSLGPQCLSCKRRRVKCDSTTPTCKRCHKDDLQCPGYTKPLQITHFHPDARSHNAIRPKKPEKNGLSSDRQRETPSIPRSPDLNDRGTLILLDSVQCLNKRLVPDIIPAHTPFQRQDFDTPNWPLIPKVIQHLMIVTVQAIQVAKTGADPLTRRNLCYYRGLGLLELEALLPSAASDQYGIALSCILMILMADMQLSPSGPAWTSHLEAARRIIMLRGGYEKCFHDLPGARSQLISFMAIDIFTATTRSAIFLDSQTAQAQCQYIPVIRRREKDIISNAYPCPQPLLEAIVYINILRVRALQFSEQESVLSHSFRAVLESIESFDATSWAHKIAGYGQLHPQRVEDCASAAFLSSWTSLALCYKSASLLYLILSSGKDLRCWYPTVRTAKHTLSRHMSALFKIASFDRDGPVESQLWKFSLWPLLISAYVHVGWDIGDESAESDLERVRMTGMFLGLRPVLSIERVLRHAQEKRAAHPGTEWKWDDGFDTRSAFVI